MTLKLCNAAMPDYVDVSTGGSRDVFQMHSANATINSNFTNLTMLFLVMSNDVNDYYFLNARYLDFNYLAPI